MRQNALVRFKTCKPYVFKKTLFTILGIGCLLYVVLTVHWITSLFICIFTALPILINISKQPSEGKGFFGKLKNTYKNMYQNYIVEYLPTDIEINENEIGITLNKAEIIRGAVVNETTTIKKENVVALIYDDKDEGLFIAFLEASTIVKNENTGKITGTILSKNKEIAMHLGSAKPVIEKLIECGYDPLPLSEIHDSEEVVDQNDEYLKFADLMSGKKSNHTKK